MLSELRGKVVVLNFWAPWCFSCEAEMASLEELKVFLKDEPFEILAITVLEGDRRRVQNRFDFPVLLDHGKKVAELYSVELLPVTIVIDKAGRIVSFPDPEHDTHETVFRGPRGWNSLRAVRALRELMAE